MLLLKKSSLCSPTYQYRHNIYRDQKHVWKIQNGNTTCNRNREKKALMVISRDITYGDGSKTAEMIYVTLNCHLNVMKGDSCGTTSVTLIPVIFRNIVHTKRHTS